MTDALSPSLIKEVKAELAAAHPLTPLASFVGLKSAFDFRALAFMAAYFITFNALWQWGEKLGGVVWVAAVLWLCWIAFCCATIIHNTIHCYMFPMSYRWTNAIIFWALTLCYGHPVSSFVPGHNQSHHRFTQLRKDLMRTSKLRHDWNLLNFLLYQPTVLKSVLVSDIEFALLQRALGKPFFRKMIGEYFLLFVTTIPFLYLSPTKWLFYFQIPHLVAQWGIVSINHLQHDGCDVNGDGSQYGNISRNFVGGWLNWWTCNNGFHSIHHIKSDLHWSLLPRVHELTVAPFIHKKIGST